MAVLVYLGFELQRGKNLQFVNLSMKETLQVHKSQYELNIQASREIVSKEPETGL